MARKCTNPNPADCDLNAAMAASKKAYEFESEIDPQIAAAIAASLKPTDYNLDAAIAASLEAPFASLSIMLHGGSSSSNSSSSRSRGCVDDELLALALHAEQAHEEKKESLTAHDVIPNMIKCPWPGCGMQYEIAAQNCGIFRCGFAFSKSGQTIQIPQHAKPGEVVTLHIASGCGRQFMVHCRANGTLTAERCEGK